MIYPTYFQIDEIMEMIHSEPRQIYIFENGYAASVINLKSDYSRPGYELAVIKNYKTDIEDLDDESIRTGLTINDLQIYLEEIKNYKKI